MNVNKGPKVKYLIIRHYALTPSVRITNYGLRINTYRRIGKVGDHVMFITAVQSCRVLDIGGVVG
jgi:hypothetical protein